MLITNEFNLAENGNTGAHFPDLQINTHNYVCVGGVNQRRRYSCKDSLRRLQSEV